MYAIRSYYASRPSIISCMAPETSSASFAMVSKERTARSLLSAAARIVITSYSIHYTKLYEIRSDREQLFADMQALDGITVWPSAANFLLFRTEGKPAIEIFEGLGKQSVLIKNMHGSHPQLRDCLRVTVGSEDENAKFLESLKRLL